MVKRLRCPDCGAKVAHLYCTTETIINCQNSSHKGFNAYKTAHQDSEEYGKKFDKVDWDYKCSDDNNG